MASILLDVESLKQSETKSSNAEVDIERQHEAGAIELRLIHQPEHDTLDERDDASLHSKRRGQVPDIVSAYQLKPMQKTSEDMSSMKPKLAAFYKNQNELISGLLQLEREENAAVMDAHVKESQDEDLVSRQKVRFAVRISLGTNVVLLILKLVASIESRSLSIIASAVDSLLDLVSGSLFFWIGRKMATRNRYHYPVSMARLEPVGIVIFSSIMGMTALVILQQAMQDIVAGASGDYITVNIDVTTIWVVCVVVGSKVCLFLYCRSVGNKSGVVQALAQDHFNDCFTNTLGTTSAVLAGYVRSLWFMDPLGATILSIYILIIWTHNGKEQISSLVGKASGPDLISKLVYLAARHDSHILRVDKVLAYHFGHRFLCEVDIVLPEQMPLKQCHDIGESLEIKIEKLDEVERAFVHLDYEWKHKAEHKIID